MGLSPSPRSTTPHAANLAAATAHVLEAAPRGEMRMGDGIALTWQHANARHGNDGANAAKKLIREGQN